MNLLNQTSELPSSRRTFSFRSVISWGFLIRVLLFGLLWGLLARWEQNSLGVGIVFIFIASLLSLYLAQEQQKGNQWFRSPLRLLSFVHYFGVQSLRGGWVIAKLALSPKPNLSPGFIKYHTDLASESQVFTFMQVVSLQPGTVSAMQNGRELTFHVMDTNSFNSAEIDDCQLRIKNILGSPAQSPVGEEKL